MLHLLQTQGAGILFGVVSLLLLAPSLLVAAQSNSKPGCPNQCGSLTIPYPFGLSTRDDCYLPDDDGLFTIDCNTTVEPNIPYWMNMSTNIQIKNISVVNHEMQIMVYVAYDCYNTTGRERWHYPHLSIMKFPISSTRNTFTAIGCDTEAFFQGYKDDSYAMGCLSLCSNITDVANRTCSGIGCCQATIPKNVLEYNISLRSFNNHSRVLQFNPCSYAFVAENGYFDFSMDYLEQMDERKVPLVMDWAIGNQTCVEAWHSEMSYVCKENTNCKDAENGTGYRCHCEEGYQGNPYLSGSDGCQDIDECETSNPCQVTSLCVNLPGKFSCSCPDGYEGDGKRNGIGCSRKTLQKNIIIRDIALGVVAALLFLLSAWWLCKRIKRRKKMKLRQKFFKQNGGLLLQQQLASPEANIEKSKLFNSEELKRATNNFNENRIIGQGGQGTVYKGMLIDGRIVAIKKSKMLYKGDVEQFINEVSILSQINHRNVVKLLGCCLETEVPLLVYEFIPNGTLYQYLHEPNEEFQVPWDVRLRIASEVAGALFYLHSASSIPIYHRDIKTTNILLDEKYRAKIADFGTSRLVALDQTHVTTVVQGTFGYLDPEYFQSSQFTDKSDVYSFGVVLVELLTGQKAISSLRTQEGRGLATYFILSVEEDRLFEILDARISNRVNREEIIALANLARRCLNLNGRMRPTMKEVAMALESLRKSLHPSDVQGIEERCWNFEIDGIEAHDVSYRSAGFEAGVPMCLTMDVYPLLSSDT